jgi:hypothetical protein
MMCSVIDNTASCKIRTVICFLHTKNMSAIEIHHELCADYSQNVMSKVTLGQWCRMFTMKTKVVKQPSVVSDDLVQSVDQKNCERWHFTISEFSWEFPQILCTVFYEIFTVRLGYHKFWARSVPKMVTGAHKTQRMASALAFL